jgi:hypothetical protein
MSENLILKEYMKEDAFLFDNISLAICKEENTNYEDVLKQCDSFEENVVLLKIVPSYYVMKTILCFKLQDYKTAHKYINGSLKYLVFVAKNAQGLSPMEKTNFEEYKINVLDQYKILIQEKPEYANNKEVVLPNSVKFITTNDETIINEELNKRVLKRQG